MPPIVLRRFSTRDDGRDLTSHAPGEQWRNGIADLGLDAAAGPNEVVVVGKGEKPPEFTDA